MATTQCHSIYQIDQASKIESGTAQIEITSLPGLAFCLGRISSSRIIGDSSNADFNISKVLSRLSKSYTGTDRFGHFARLTTIPELEQTIGVTPAKNIFEQRASLHTAASRPDAERLSSLQKSRAARQATAMAGSSRLANSPGCSVFAGRRKAVDNRHSFFKDSF